MSDEARARAGAFKRGSCGLPPAQRGSWPETVTGEMWAELAEAAVFHRPLRVTAAIAPLLQPILDVLTAIDAQPVHRSFVARVVVVEMLRRRTGFWTWSDDEWVETICPTQADFRARYTCRRNGCRQPLLAVAYLLGGLRNLFAFPVAGIFRVRLAYTVFGAAAIDEALRRVQAVVADWGYSSAAIHQDLRAALCTALLANRSPCLEDLTLDGLAALRACVRAEGVFVAITLLSRVLRDLGILRETLAPARKARTPGQCRGVEGIAPEWLDWCRRWHTHARRYVPPVRDAHLGILYKAGRWLAQRHPGVTSPAQWTYEIAADWVATVAEMNVGDFGGLSDRRMYGQRLGQPLTPRAKYDQIGTLRRFFRDLHDPPFDLPRRFDPVRAFRAPAPLMRLIGPDPRVVDMRAWAKLVHAALNLTEADLPIGASGVPVYPLALVRAVAVVWCFSGLRADEIRRLEVGCIRRQHEDVVVPETGEVLPKEAACFLTVPANKTSRAFPKAVNPLVGVRIAAWEALRPAHQPRLRDRKTGRPTEYLFCYRGRLIARDYINSSLIPLLCRKGGVPLADERGRITSHRARATIASLLYNAPEGLSLLDLMAWLGHSNPATTQHYIRLTPTKVASAVARVNDRALRLVEVLVDTTGDAHGGVALYYVLGNGFCANPEWAACPFRMACLKCDYYVPQDVADQIAARDGVRRFLEEIPLTDDELAAAEGDAAKLDELIEKNRHRSPPRARAPFADSVASRARRPLPVIQAHP